MGDAVEAERIAVIGAGLAGAACARRLHDAGCEVVVFEQGAEVGGRLATARLDGEAQLCFDQGAQYFTARAPEFLAQVAHWQQVGRVGMWPVGPVPRISPAKGVVERAPAEPRFVGVPAMQSLIQEHLSPVRLRLGQRVTRVARVASRFTLEVRGATAPETAFDQVLLALPAPEALALMEGLGSKVAELAGCLAQIQYDPCIALRLRFAAALDCGWTAAWLDDDRLGWVACDRSKPQRSAQECWVAHSSVAFAADQLSSSPSQTRALMLERFLDLTGAPPPVHASIHSFRHARVQHSLEQSALYSEALGLGCCGDYCLGARVEAAFMSGQALANRVLQVRA